LLEQNPDAIVIILLAEMVHAQVYILFSSLTERDRKETKNEIEEEIKDKWIKQAESEDNWFLVIKVTRKGSYILFPTNLSHYFRYKNYLRYTSKYIITSYTDFWKNNADRIRQLNEKHTSRPESLI
jgi:hypothetical protein